MVMKKLFLKAESMHWQKDVIDYFDNYMYLF